MSNNNTPSSECPKCHGSGANPDFPLANCSCWPFGAPDAAAVAEGNQLSEDATHPTPNAGEPAALRMLTNKEMERLIESGSMSSAYDYAAVIRKFCEVNGLTIGATPTGVAADESTRAPDGWRCFHCDQVFTDADAAREHFGSSEIQQPACQIDIAEYRRMQEARRRQCEEDTDWHRAFYKLGGEHTRAMQQWGDLEYARGLRDGVNLPADSPERASLASGERPSAPAPEGSQQ